MARFPLRAALAALVALLLPAAEATARLDATAVLEKSEAAIGRLVEDHQLTGTDGQAFGLETFRGKPLVISLVYTACSAICPATTQQLKSAVERARLALGHDSFRMLTVGFDARNDTPGRMAAFAIDQNIANDPSWRVASADQETLAALLDDLGFSYSAAAGGFQHIVQTTIIDADGRVHRQIYGEDFPLQIFVEPLKALVFGVTTRSFTPAALADRLRFLCTVYDATTGRYRTDYAIYFGVVIGGLSLVLMALLIVRMWVRNRRLERIRDGRLP